MNFNIQRISINKIILLLISFILFSGIGAHLSSIAVLVSLCLIYFFLKKNCTLNLENNLIYLIFLVFILTKSLYLIGGHYNPISEYHSVLKIIKQDIAVCIVCIVFSKKKQFFDKELLIFMQILYNTTVIISIILMLIFGRNLYRDLGEGSDNLFLAPNSFFVSSILFSMFYIKRFLQTKSIKFLLLVFLNVSFILLSNYTTQFLFSIFGIFLIILFYKASRIRKRILVLIILILIFFFYLCPDVLAKIIVMSANSFFYNNEIIYTRLMQISTFLTVENVQSGDVYGRLQLARLSLDTFKNNVLFGIPFDKYNTYSSGLHVGGHMQWFDDLARYGTVGCFIRILMIRHIWKNKYFDMGKDSLIKNVSAIVLFLYGFFNPFISIQILLLLFFLFNMDDDYKSMNKQIEYKIDEVNNSNDK